VRKQGAAPDKGRGAHQYGDGFGATLRLHIGLEDVNDLIDDLEQAFGAMHRVHAANRLAPPE